MHFIHNAHKPAYLGNYVLCVNCIIKAQLLSYIFERYTRIGKRNNFNSSLYDVMMKPDDQGVGVVLLKHVNEFPYHFTELGEITVSNS